MARPSKLTEKVQETICQALRDGETLDVASRAGGITYQTLLNWKVQGKAEGEGPYFDFAVAIEAADPAFRTDMVGIVATAARGGTTVTETRVVTKRKLLGGGSDDELEEFLKSVGARARDGQFMTEEEARKMLMPVEETTTVITRTTLPDWRAALELLQRRYPGTWNKTTTLKFGGDDNDLMKELAEMGIDFNEFIGRIAEELVALRRGRALTDSGSGSGEGTATGGEITG